MTRAGKTTGAGGSADSDELVHCYRLIFQVDPGGSRKAESFVAGTLEEARQAALDDLGSADGAYHALFYGEEIVLQCWEGSRKLASIDLHPFITYQVPGIDGAITFKDGEEAPLSLDDDALTDSLMDGEIVVTVTIDWAAIELPPLAGRPVRPGETVTLERGHRWEHGHHTHWDAKIEP